MSGTSPSRTRVKTSRTSCRLHARLEVVEQRVVRLVHLEAGRVLAAELDVALEIRAEELEVVLRARLDPDRECLGAGQRLLLAQLGRDTQLLVAVAPGDADQARLVGVVVERLLVRPELLEQVAQLVGDHPLVDQLRDGPELLRPDRRRRAAASSSAGPRPRARPACRDPTSRSNCRGARSTCPRSRLELYVRPRRSGRGKGLPFRARERPRATARGSRRCRFAASVSGSWNAPPQCAHGSVSVDISRAASPSGIHAKQLDDRRRALDVAGEGAARVRCRARRARSHAAGTRSQCRAAPVATIRHLVSPVVREGFPQEALVRREHVVVPVTEYRIGGAEDSRPPASSVRAPPAGSGAARRPSAPCCSAAGSARTAARPPSRPGPCFSIASANASSSDVVASMPMSAAISRFSSSVTSFRCLRVITS